MAALRILTLACVGLLAAFHADLARAVEPPQGPEPVGSPGDWVTTADYPIDAALNQQSGTTQFRLAIDQRGTPKQCEVIISSGAKSLDISTCDLLMERARFRPARDKAGLAVESTYSNRVRWILPVIKEGFPPRYIIEVTIDPDGIAVNCVIVERTSIYEQSDLCANRVGQKMWSADPNRPKLIVRIRQTFEFEIPRE